MINYKSSFSASSLIVSIVNVKLKTCSLLLSSKQIYAVQFKTVELKNNLLSAKFAVIIQKTLGATLWLLNHCLTSCFTWSNECQYPFLDQRGVGSRSMIL